jgi:hypothetical protein
VRRRYVILVGFACLLALGSSQLTAANVVVQERIKDVDACGLVMDPSGHGIPDATISATSGGNVIASATTLSDGSFSFMQNFNSRIQLSVQARGFAGANGAIEHMGAAGSRKCRHPVYVVLAVGEGSSYLTSRKSGLPRSK